MNASAASVLDIQGMNPFHFAISNGKRWDSGLKDLAALVQEWPQASETLTGLYPFMLAATSECAQDDVDTAYGLLRFDASTIQRLLGHGREAREAND
jgi:hypothetical protein